MNEYGKIIERYLEGNAEVFGDKHFPSFHFPTTGPALIDLVSNCGP